MNRNFTKDHPNYIRPTNSEILDILDLYLYTEYFPRDIFQELLNLVLYQLLDNSYKLSYLPFISVDEDIKLKYLEFFNSLQWEFYCSLNLPPTETVIRILKDLSETVDLRKFNNLNVDFNLCEVDNSEFQVKQEEEIFFNSVLDKETYNIDVQIVLKYVSFLNNGLTFLNKGNDNTKVKTRLKSCKDILKARKSSFIKPTFMIDVLTKKLPITDIVNISSDKEVLVYMEDASSSMLKNNGYLLSKAVQKVLMEDSRVIHFYRFVGEDIQFFELTSLEDKLACFTKEHPYHKGNCNYTYTFNKILPNYNGGKVIIVTDSQDNIPKSLNTGSQLYCLDISNKLSVDMKRLCKLTNGKYIKL